MISLLIRRILPLLVLSSFALSSCVVHDRGRSSRHDPGPGRGYGSNHGPGR